MDIAIIAPNSIRIKGKKTAIVTDPFSITTKTQADIIILLEKAANFSIPEKILDLKLVISGTGEYEVAGAKIMTQDFTDNLFHLMSLDGVDICLAKVSVLPLAKEKLKDCQICIFEADAIFNQALLGDLNPRMLCFYGEKAMENVKALGKEMKTIQKISIMREKLPQEMQVILLGEMKDER